jgi:magnesium-protoporphyrin O-methyltransferase
MSEMELRAMIKRSAGLADWRSGRTQRISSGFYTSQALEVVR